MERNGREWNVLSVLGQVLTGPKADAANKHTQSATNKQEDNSRRGAAAAVGEMNRN